MNNFLIKWNIFEAYNVLYQPLVFSYEGKVYLIFKEIYKEVEVFTIYIREHAVENADKAYTACPISCNRLHVRNTVN